MKAKDLDRQWKKKVGKAITDNPLDRLEEYEKLLGARPPGGFTIREAAKKRSLAKKRDVNPSTMRDFLNKLVRLGKAQKHCTPGSRNVYFTLLK